MLSKQPASPPIVRVYRPSVATKVFVVFAGTILTGFGFIGPVLLALNGNKFGYSDTPIWAWILFGTGAVVLPTISIRFMSRALRAKVVWSKDTLEMFGRRGHQVLRVADIIGKRYVREERGRNVEILTRLQSGDSFVIPLDWVLPFDSDFKEWLETIPKDADKLSK